MDVAGPADGAWAAMLSRDTAAAMAALGSLRRGLSEDQVNPAAAAAWPNTLPRPWRRRATAELASQLANMSAVLMVATSASAHAQVIEWPGALLHPGGHR